MAEFTSVELQQFFAGLRRPPDGAPSLGTRYARESGYTSRFISYFDPFLYERDMRELAGRLPQAGDLLAVVSPKDRYSVRFFHFQRRTDGEAALPFNRRTVKRLWASHPGFQGLGGDQELELEYQKDPAAGALFEKALSLTAATALYRVLCERSGRLYWLEKGWSTAHLLCPGMTYRQAAAPAASTGH